MVLKATQEQYDALNGYRNKSHRLIFDKDGNNNWVVCVGVLSSPHFKEIHNQLNELERIEYVPIPHTEEE